MSEPLVPVQLPECGQPSEAFCKELEQAMLKATWAGVHGTAAVLPPALLQKLTQSVTDITNKEPTLLEVQPSAQQQQVTVVGDTHGQYHDVCRMFELYGRPSADRVYIFNGDFVDRGAWGVEVLALLMAYKWLYPHNVYLVRGNHESNIITQVYGFAAELKAKYGKAAKGLFTHIKRFFASLPLAALVEHKTLILHGGLFRKPPPSKTKAGTKRRRSTGVKLTVGSLEDLRKAYKGAQDPDPDKSLKNLVACDVLWSDPVNDPGIRVNEARGCGTIFGPDVTAEFLAANGLQLIIRSHEGPDARDKRSEGDRMPSVDSGYAEDHVTPSGKLVTLFSAPDYPQFIADGEDRYHNKAAVLHLTAPDYATPRVESFEAVLPRPQVESYYEVPSYTEDEDDGEEQEGTQPGSSQQAGSSCRTGDTQAGSSQQDGTYTADEAASTASTAFQEAAGPMHIDIAAAAAAAPAAAAASSRLPLAAADQAAAEEGLPVPDTCAGCGQQDPAAEGAAAAAAAAAVVPAVQSPVAEMDACCTGPDAAQTSAVLPGVDAAATAAAACTVEHQQPAEHTHMHAHAARSRPDRSHLQHSSVLFQAAAAELATGPVLPAGGAASDSAAVNSSQNVAVAPLQPPQQPQQPAVAAEPTPDRPGKRQKVHDATHSEHHA